MGTLPGPCNEFVNLAGINLADVAQLVGVHKFAISQTHSLKIPAKKWIGWARYAWK